MAYLELTDIEKYYDDFHALKGINLAIEKEEFVVFVGPSGCGKTTLLRSISGLETVSSGQIRLDGKDITDAHPSKRNIAMVFQNYALFPHLNVFDNIAFGLKLQQLSKEAVRKRVDRAARLLHLEQLLQRKPKQLSGGQRQRVAIGRAIVKEPKLFLFDEPLSNLDAKLRVRMRVELLNLHYETRNTAIYVTHDQVEAMTMADRIVILHDGRIEQVGSPLELYEKPRNQFVAGFIGSPQMNFLPLKVESQKPRQLRCRSATIGVLTLPIQVDQPLEGRTVTLGVRPEHVSLGASPDTVSLPGVVNIVENLGSETFVHVELGENAILVVKTRPSAPLERNHRIQVGLPANHLYLFGEDEKGVPLQAAPV
ncbi:MAG: ABC transporter ATP-binding protein [Verrucomicrobia bacterium]|nr:ABC transporter ATP-binding protein [Verrucomicrobiota bacterium]